MISTFSENKKGALVDVGDVQSTDINIPIMMMPSICKTAESNTWRHN